MKETRIEDDSAQMALPWDFCTLHSLVIVADLAEINSGANVRTDSCIEFTLCSYFATDVLLYKISCRLQAMEENPYFAGAGAFVLEFFFCKCHHLSTADKW